MNPLTNMKNIKKLSEQELGQNSSSSWHDQYRDSAWIFIGSLPYDLTEGDIICIFSQYGEIVNINLIRDKDTGKSRGFCFLCYEDQRSTILAVDNFNGIEILKRKIRVDHVQKYKVPKGGKKVGEETRKLYEEGCAPRPIQVEKEPLAQNDFRETIDDRIKNSLKLPERLPIYSGRDYVKEEPISPSTIPEVSDKKKQNKRKENSNDRETSKRRNRSKSKEPEIKERTIPTKPPTYRIGATPNIPKRWQ